MNCNTPNCINQDWQGKFIGNLCVPCELYYREELKKHKEECIHSSSQAYKNHIAECKAMLKDCEIFIIKEKYK